MVLYDLIISTHRKDFYYTGSPRSIPINVSRQVQYDQLSKRINKFKHNLQYTESNYKNSDYNITVYDKNALFYRYLLIYNSPQPKVMSFEIYFRSNDPENTHPLVIGIIQENQNPRYYTYNFLIRHTTPKIYYQASYTSLPNYIHSFGAEDLITRLIEEHDATLGKNKGDKLVVRVDAKPINDTSDKYPKTGPNKDNITLSKSTYHDHFYKFEHKIDPKLNVSSFYLCYENDSLFVDGLGRFMNLIGVDVYYNKYYGKTPIIIVLKSKTEDKLYEYSDLCKDFLNSNKAKKFYSLQEIHETGLHYKLKSINDDVNKNLLYLIEHKNTYCYRIKVTNQENKSNEGFTKYTHKPEDDYKSNCASVTYKTDALCEKKFDKAEPIEELKDQKLSSIDVFFGTKDPSIPLLIKVFKSNNTVEFYSHNKEDGSYWEKITEQGFTDSDTQVFNKKLKEIESNLFESICILVDNQSNYTKEEIISKTIKKLTDSQPEKVDVTTISDMTWLEKMNYKCFEHNLEPSAGSEPKQSYNNVKLRLFVASTSENYSEITLYNNENLSEFSKEYIYYGKEKTSDNVNGKIRVIFYCKNDRGKNDPRPLLLSYQDKIYKPSSLKDYGYKWVLVKDVKLNSDFSENTKLLETLKSVSYLLNPVYVNQLLDKKYLSVKQYEICTFNRTKIEVNIRPKDLNCYKKYEHTSNIGYVLGEISYNGSKLFDSYDEYVKSINKNGIFPSSVIAYYYLYDIGHLYPLVVALNFGPNDVKYYKLRSRDNPLKWEPISDSYDLSLANDSNIERLLYNVRYNLGIQYDKKRENLIMRSADKCNERNNVGLIVGVLSTIALMAGGIAGAFYKFPEFFHSIYSRIK